MPSALYRLQSRPWTTGRNAEPRVVQKFSAVALYGLLVIVFDKEPVLAFAVAVHAHQIPSALQSVAVQDE